MPSDSFKTTLRVTWADTDAAQVVHYANFFRFFEAAEEELYRHLGFSFADFRTKGLWFPRVEAFCQYKKPARFDDLLEVEVTVEELKEKSVKYGFRVVNKETSDLLATGHLAAVVVDKQTGEAAPIPREFVQKLKSSSFFPPEKPNSAPSPSWKKVEPRYKMTRQTLSERIESLNKRNIVGTDSRFFSWII